MLSQGGVRVWNFRWRAEFEGEGVVEGSMSMRRRLSFGRMGMGV